MKTVLRQSSSAGVTRAFAGQLIVQLKTGGSLLLRGELGAGKTTFVQGLAAALHIPQTVTSPTFILLNVYEASHPVIQQLVHLDLYRLHSSAEVRELDLATWLSNPRALVVVEWPERAPDLWTDTLGTIEFNLGDGISQRTLTMSGSIAAYFSVEAGKIV